MPCMFPKNWHHQHKLDRIRQNALNVNVLYILINWHSTPTAGFIYRLQTLECLWNVLN